MYIAAHFDFSTLHQQIPVSSSHTTAIFLHTQEIFKSTNRLLPNIFLPATSPSNMEIFPHIFLSHAIRENVAPCLKRRTNFFLSSSKKIRAHLPHSGCKPSGNAHRHDIAQILASPHRMRRSRAASAPAFAAASVDTFGREI